MHVRVYTGMVRPEWTSCRDEVIMKDINGGNKAPHIIKCVAPRFARFIKIMRLASEKTGLKRLHLTEVQVRAKPPSRKSKCHYFVSKEFQVRSKFF